MPLTDLMICSFVKTEHQDQDYRWRTVSTEEALQILGQDCCIWQSFGHPIGLRFQHDQVPVGKCQCAGLFEAIQRGNNRNCFQHQHVRSMMNFLKANIQQENKCNLNAKKGIS